MFYYPVARHLLENVTDSAVIFVTEVFVCHLKSSSISRHTTCFDQYCHQVFKIVVDGYCSSSIFVISIFKVWSHLFATVSEHILISYIDISVYHVR
jgi:hypothetical protein